jgi:hypothetical protein
MFQRDLEHGAEQTCRNHSGRAFSVCMSGHQSVRHGDMTFLPQSSYHAPGYLASWPSLQNLHRLYRVQLSSLPEYSTDPVVEFLIY